MFENQDVTITPWSGVFSFLLREKDGWLSRRLRWYEVPQDMKELHAVHGHFAESITKQECICQLYWLNRFRDIFEYCRTCPGYQAVGSLRLTRLLLLPRFLQWCVPNPSLFNPEQNYKIYFFTCLRLRCSFSPIQRLFPFHGHSKMGNNYHSFPKRFNVPSL